MTKNPFWSQKSKRTTGRNKILSELSKSHLTFGELEAKTGLSRPTLSKHLEALRHEGMVQKKNTGRFIAYEITEKAINEEKVVQQSLVGAVGFINELLPEIHPQNRFILDFANMAKQDPEMFKRISQWTYELMEILASEKGMGWIMKSGLPNFPNRVKLLQAEVLKRISPIHVSDKTQLIDVMDKMLDALREIVNK